MSYKKLRLSSEVKALVPQPAFELTGVHLAKLTSVGQVVLAALAVTGVAALAIAAPNALQAIRLFKKSKGYGPVSNKQAAHEITRTFYYLKRRKLISVRETSEGLVMELTNKGKERLKQLQWKQLYIPKDGIWDGTFWQVAADIPTEWRLGADALRIKLKEMKFYSLQRTLWFYPFDPRKQIGEIAAYYGIQDFVTIMRVDLLDPADREVLTGYFKDQKIL